MEYVILVDPGDRMTGKMEKMEAHVKGLMHRAFSAFIFNENKQLMLQQRALTKYHSPGLWTNTCCSHPRPGEDTEQAVHRRLMEEMGFDCNIQKAFEFAYRADVGQGLIEHEYDHVFFGTTHQEPAINLEEVNDWKFMDMDAIRQDMVMNPDHYTVWFRIAFEQASDFLNQG